MFGLRKLRFADLGTGLSMLIGTAGVLAASALHAADPGCAYPAGPAVCNDQIFMDAAERLKNLNPCVSGCAPTAAPASTNTCVPAAPACGDGAATADSSAPWSLTDVFDNGCGGIFGIVVRCEKNCRRLSTDPGCFLSHSRAGFSPYVGRHVRFFTHAE